MSPINATSSKFRTVSLIAFAVCLIGTAPTAHAAGPKKLKQPATSPLVISQPGSYVLTSNITVPDANTTVISITADNVTLDRRPDRPNVANAARIRAVFQGGVPLERQRLPAG